MIRTTQLPRLQLPPVGAASCRDKRLIFELVDPRDRGWKPLLRNNAVFCDTLFSRDSTRGRGATLGIGLLRAIQRSQVQTAARRAEARGRFVVAVEQVLDLPCTDQRSETCHWPVRLASR